MLFGNITEMGELSVCLFVCFCQNLEYQFQSLSNVGTTTLIMVQSFLGGQSKIYGSLQTDVKSSYFTFCFMQIRSSTVACEQGNLPTETA